MQRCRSHRLVQLFYFLLCLLFSLLTSAALAADLSDEQKKQQVYTLYSEYQQKFPAVEEISPDDVLQLERQGKDLVLIDAREADEMAVSMLPGAISEEELLHHLDRYADSFLVAYCTIGYRSGLFAKAMIDRKVIVHNLKGGILGWLHAGGAVYSDGRIVHRVHVYGSKWDLAPGQFETVRYSFFQQLF